MKYFKLKTIKIRNVTLATIIKIWRTNITNFTQNQHYLYIYIYKLIQMPKHITNLLKLTIKIRTEKYLTQGRMFMLIYSKWPNISH